MTQTNDLLKTFAPTGALRASINLGNPILANRDPASGLPVGVSVDLAKEFARRLGVDVQMTVVDGAARSVELVTSGQADIGFFAIDPVRGKGIQFTPPYVVIEGSYLVPNESAITDNQQVDQAGNRIVVGAGSAYDLFLTREIKNATLVRAKTSPTVVKTFLEERAEVAAGVRQQLEADARQVGGVRLLPGRFMVINQAMGTALDRGHDALVSLTAFVEEMKSSGFVAAALQRHGIQGAAVAPAAFQTIIR